MRYGKRFAFGTALALTACGQQTTEQGQASSSSVQDMAASEASEPGSATRAPGISVTAAPGVAFTYAYSFRLPSTAIARTQEAHAQACEKLGLARCRITGMRYRLLGENNIEAMLAFKLDPTIAREFGRRGILTAENAKGTLVDAEITGADAGSAITRLDADRARAAEARARIDRELAAARTATERAELQAQRAELDRQVEAARAGASEQRESLAQTPMTFTYQSGPAIRGFDTSAPLTSAIDTALASAEVTLVVVLGAIAIFGPPALALLLLWLLWRRVRPLLARRKTAVDPG
jgi:hypothetical protein